MKKILFVCCYVFLLHGCNVDKGKKVDEGVLSFNTSDRAEMFFKNVRQSDYLVEENKAAGMILYTHKKWLSAEAPAVVPVIVFNWRNDKAYVMLRWSAGLETAKELEIRAATGAFSESRKYVHGDMAEQRSLAIWVYNTLPEGVKFSISTEAGVEPLFPTDDLQDVFRITVYDYLRLTGVF